MSMAGLFDFLKYQKDAPGVRVDPAQALELRRLANLFLVAGVTLVLFILRAVAEMLAIGFVPRAVYVAWGVVLLAGWAATVVYGAFVTFAARSWGWFVLCLIPFTGVPSAAAYAWIRRQQIERQVLAESRTKATRQRRGGRSRR